MYVSLKCKLDSNEILNNLADIYIYIYINNGQITILLFKFTIIFIDLKQKEKQKKYNVINIYLQIHKTNIHR